MVTVEPVKLTQLVQLTLVAIFRLWPCPRASRPRQDLEGSPALRISGWPSVIKTVLVRSQALYADPGLFEVRRDARWWLCPSVYCAPAGAVRAAGKAVRAAERVELRWDGDAIP